MTAITDVAGIQVGHHHRLDPDAAMGAGWATGVTVVLTPPGTVGAVDVRGGAPGTRETDLLDPVNSVRYVDAVLLAGGSAYGLAAADGVMRWLEEHDRGVAMKGGVVPIAPAAVIFDPEERLKGLRDSKLLTPEARDELAIKIRSRAVAWAIGESAVGEIDALNIHHATLLAMKLFAISRASACSLVLSDSMKSIDKLRVCLRVHDERAAVAMELGNQHTFGITRQFQIAIRGKVVSLKCLHGGSPQLTD